MAVITFSRVFPAYHPKAGQPTYFVEKVVKSLHKQGMPPFDVNCDFSTEMYYICDPKHHTIRAGNCWKVGDKFSPCVWSGKPYQSKQIQFAPDIQIKKVWEFEIEADEDYRCLLICGQPFVEWNGALHTDTGQLSFLAGNDGLNVKNMLDWFNVHPKTTYTGFKGQIICWNQAIEY